MCDCFPKTGGGFPLPDRCNEKTGSSEYAVNFKRWCNPIASKTFAPDRSGEIIDVWKQRYSFSKGPRFGVPPYCDCTPPPERFRFETTYNHDFTECIHKDGDTRRNPSVAGTRPQYGQFVPKQFLCPFTNETTYARSYDMSQPHFSQVCSQNQPCGGGDQGCNQEDCCDDQCQNPCGIEIRFAPQKKKKPTWRRLRIEDLVPPGTDTSDCCQCPKKETEDCIDCTDNNNCCQLHQGATTPTQRYPNDGSTPKYVPDPRKLPVQPTLLCGGGTCENPVEPQFPTKKAIVQARERLMDELEKERCRFPPECIESMYRASYKTPPLTQAPKYCSREQVEEARKAEAEVAEKGLPPCCVPSYCAEGGHPPDPRPPFDHMSTYDADYIWDKKERFRFLGGEIPCKFELKPVCPRTLDVYDVFPPRTEEKERWGDDWEYNPQPADDDDC